LTTTAMLHEIDPRITTRARIGDIGHISVLHNQVLVATYLRPDKTVGGIILPGSAKKEDEYQGKVGLVIAKGPLAFVDDDRTQFGGQDINVGDWVAYRMSDGWQLTLKGRATADNPKGEHHCRMLHDVDIKLVVSHPDDLL
jgi:co-chaperonin GroES (HSP10)